MTLSADRLAELERLARNATTGPWDGRIGVGPCDYIAKAERAPDASFIAALSPEVVLELLAEVDRMRPVYAAAVDLEDNWDLRLIAEGEDWYSDFARLEDAAKAATGKAPSADRDEMDAEQAIKAVAGG